MSAVRLDAATLDRVRAGEPLYLCDEAGRPVFAVTNPPAVSTGDEPVLTDEDRRRILSSPVRYKLSEVWERIHRGERF